jgi:hypothetical protein
MEMRRVSANRAAVTHQPSSRQTPGGQPRSHCPREGHHPGVGMEIEAIGRGFCWCGVGSADRPHRSEPGDVRASGGRCLVKCEEDLLGGANRRGEHDKGTHVARGDDPARGVARHGATREDLRVVEFEARLG